MPKPETILPDTPFGTPEDWFWVALAERKAGHEDLAQRWANRSIAWLDKAIVNPRDPSILGSKQEPILPVQSWSRGVQTTGIQSLGRSGDRMIDRGWIDPSWRDLLVLQILRKEFESMEKSGEPPPD